MEPEFPTVNTLHSTTSIQELNVNKGESIYKAVFPGKYIQGENAINELPALMKLLGKNGLILASPTVIKKILPQYNLQESGVCISLELFNGECCEKELKRLSEIITKKKIDVVVGMGGGKTIDTAKIISDRAGIPVIVVPTIASTDAPTSGCAVIYSEDGIYESACYQKLNPQIVLVDLNIISKAPVRFLVAGMGDALATWFEARSCQRTKSNNECGGLSTLTGLTIAKLCYDTLLQYGTLAKIACENKIITPALNHIVEANILLSGIGFESSGLAAAHSIHNGLTSLEETHKYYHGEKVAFGLLASLHLTDSPTEEIEIVYSFCEKVGLPTTLRDIGLENVSKSHLMEAAIKACAPSEFIHHEAGCITPDRVLNSMIAADALGRQRKILK